MHIFRFFLESTQIFCDEEALSVSIYSHENNTVNYRFWLCANINNFKTKLTRLRSAQPLKNPWGLGTGICWNVNTQAIIFVQFSNIFLRQVLNLLYLRFLYLSTRLLYSKQVHVRYSVLSPEYNFSNALYLYYSV